MPRRSTLDPDGPLQGAITTLERLGCKDEAGAIKKLLVEWLQIREQKACLEEELERLKQN